MDCSSPGSSVHGIFWVRILEWVAISNSRGSSWPRDQTHVSCLGGGFFTHWASGEAPILTWSPSKGSASKYHHTAGEAGVGGRCLGLQHLDFGGCKFSGHYLDGVALRTALPFYLPPYRERCLSLCWPLLMTPFITNSNWGISSVQFSSVSQLCLTLQPHGLQHARLLWPSPNPGAYSNSCPSSQWCHPTISSSFIPFSSHIQSFPGSGSFPMSQLFTSSGQSIVFQLHHHSF